MIRERTFDKLVTAIKTERARRGGEGRRVFLDLDSSAELAYGLGAREAAGVLRSHANREILRQRLGAEKVEYLPSKYHKASGGGYDVGFVKYRERPARREPPSVKISFGKSQPATTHATKKTGRQLDREIAEALATENNEGIFYLADASPTSAPLDEPELKTRLAAKRAAMKLVRDKRYRAVEVWHRWQGGRYMQGLASDEGWSDV